MRNVSRQVYSCVFVTPSPPFFLIEQEILAELVRRHNFHSKGNSNTWEKSEGAEVFRD